jgi:hypothetical protein
MSSIGDKIRQRKEFRFFFVRFQLISKLQGDWNTDLIASAITYQQSTAGLMLFSAGYRRMPIIRGESWTNFTRKTIWSLIKRRAAMYQTPWLSSHESGVRLGHQLPYTLISWTRSAKQRQQWTQIQMQKSKLHKKTHTYCKICNIHIYLYVPYRGHCK